MKISEVFDVVEAILNGSYTKADRFYEEYTRKQAKQAAAGASSQSTSSPTVENASQTKEMPAGVNQQEMILIDGQNVIYGSVINPEPNLSNLLGLVLELCRRGYAFKCFFDASTFYALKNRSGQEQAGAYHRLCERFPDHFIIAPQGTKADDYILSYADSFGSQIISNDRYREYADKYTWLKSEPHRRVPFLKHSNMVQVVQLGINALVPADLKISLNALHGVLTGKTVASQNEIHRETINSAKPAFAAA